MVGGEPCIPSLTRPYGNKGTLLGSAKDYVIHVLDNGLRLGFVGLAGTDWVSNCESLPPCYIESPVEVASRLANYLREHELCDIVIALTHMRLAEDIQVANATSNRPSRVDLLLGGHDHEVTRRFVGDTNINPENIEKGRKTEDVVIDGMLPDVEGYIKIIKSGTDWSSISLLRMTAQRNGQGAVVASTIKLHQYFDIQAAIYAPKSPLFYIVETLTAVHDRVGILVQRPLLHAAIPLEGRSSKVRSEETNQGNMLADAVREFYGTDVAFFNSGAIRCEQILAATISDGPALLARDIINICPFGNALVVKKISGAIILRALENSVSDMHADGRFLQISGLRIVVNRQHNQGSRILSVMVNRAAGVSQLDPMCMYTVAMSIFIAQGFDGYTWLPEQETIIGEEGAITDTSLLLFILGHVGESDLADGSVNISHAKGIERARRLIIVGKSSADSLPIVRPVDGRIRFI